MKISVCILKSVARCISRLFTFAFALFVAAGGLLEGNVSAEERPVNVQVLDSHSLKAIRGIQVILRDALFPLYGVNSYSPIAGYGIDTAITNNNGIATLSIPSKSVASKEVFLDFNDIDFGQNGTYQKIQVFTEISDSVMKFYLLPDVSNYTIRGIVKGYCNEPVKITYSNDMFSVSSIELFSDVKAYIKIFNVNGILMHRIFSDGSGVISWNTKTIPAGTYVVSYTSGIQRNSMKVLIR